MPKAKAINGFVTICRSFVNELWNVTKEDDMKKLGNITTNFDACGIKRDYDILLRPSIDSGWSNVIDFLEWFGILYYEGFGFIIVDDEDENMKGVDCFNKARFIGLTAMASLASLGFYWFT